MDAPLEQLPWLLCFNPSPLFITRLYFYQSCYSHSHFCGPKNYMLKQSTEILAMVLHGVKIILHVEQTISRWKKFINAK